MKNNYYTQNPTQTLTELFKKADILKEQIDQRKTKMLTYGLLFYKN